MVLYESTRGGKDSISSAEAIKRGISPNGGLYVPQQIKEFNMKEINDLVGVPLVLHGGSGIPDFQIKEAIARGTAKINVNTECQQAFTAIVREVLKKDEKVYDPRKVVGPGMKGIADVVRAKCEVFGCVGKAA